MKTLLIKDLRYLYMQKTSFIMFLIIAVFIGISTSPSVIMGYLIFICSTFAVSTIGYDDVDHCHAFLLTLPCNRKNYASEKYLFGFLTSIISMLAGYLISLLTSYFTGKDYSATELILEAISLIPATILMLDILIPFQFKYGVQKSRLMLLIFFGIITIIIYTTIKILEMMNIDLNYLFNEISTLTIIKFIFVLYIIASLVTVFSILINTKIVQNKEY